MPAILTLLIVAAVSWAAWQDRAVVVDEWDQLLRDLGL